MIRQVLVADSVSHRKSGSGARFSDGIRHAIRCVEPAMTPECDFP
jgi:hypothetical protein